jgi:23S rRNA (cytosine1962-C5)-methyltransferase
LREEAARQATEFANRLRTRAHHLRRWPTKRGITCYRIYERDIPEIPLVVDRYEDALHVAEFARPHDRTPAEHADWLDLMVRTATEALDTPKELVFVKHRDRQRGPAQYERVAQREVTKIVNEGGLKFKVNLSDYVDTGLFLDHRITRSMVREAAAGKDFLNGSSPATPASTSPRFAADRTSTWQSSIRRRSPTASGWRRTGTCSKTTPS